MATSNKRLWQRLLRGDCPRCGQTGSAVLEDGTDAEFETGAPARAPLGLIAGVVLCMFGTGAMRGFAVVLSLGIVTSMFTALLLSRALLTLMYGGARRPAQLSI